MTTTWRPSSLRPGAIVREQIGPRLAARRPRRIDLPLSGWGLRIGPNGVLWREGVDLQQLARTEGTPLHVVDATALDRNAARAMTPLRSGHGADIFYSYKTNPIPAVLDRLHRQGIGAEVISPFELWLAFRLGVPPERIIYNGPAKSPDSLREAITRRVYAINANSVDEAVLIRTLASEVGVVANLGVRVAVPDAWGGQFGVAAWSSDLDELITAAMADPWTDLIAFHAHRGTSIRSLETWQSFIGGVLATLDGLHQRTGWVPRVVDLGGSLACPSVAAPSKLEYRFNRAFGSDLLPPDTSACLAIEHASEVAFEAIDHHFATAGWPRPHVVQEPGRAMTADTQLLLTSVLDVKLDGPLPYAVLDAGINIAEPVPNEYHQLFSASAPGAEADRSYRLAGPICTPADVLYNNWRLPRLEPGHVLAIMDTGAYFVPFSTEFSFARPAIVVQDGDELAVVRRRQSFDDLVACDERRPVAPEA